MENNFESNDNKIHPTAIVHPNAKLGKNNKIGAYTVINDHVEIGNNNFFGPHCIIGEVAEDNKFNWQFAKRVIIGNNNRFTKQVTIDCGTVRDTIIFNNTLTLRSGHIGHDVFIEDNCRIGANAIVGGHVTMQKNSILGLTSVIQPRINIPEGSVIGAMTNVTKKSEMVSNWVHYGNPCKAIRERD
ncbi:MAG: hypothetical protein H0X63_05190 [Flavobacteriales bacterium]|nr:hypothetical protein [Flavobacteriales bacterium]